MHVIAADFESLDEMPASALFGAMGVYVIWSSRADVRPSYLGEGKLIHRFAVEHIERFGVAMTGYAAIMGKGSERQRKSDAEILETILLEIGEDIDQCPANNDSRGKRKGIRKHYDSGHNLIRLNVSGYHPLRWGRRLNEKAVIDVELWQGDDGLEIEVHHPWRRIT